MSDHQLSTEANRTAEINRWLGGMLTQFCCIIPVGSFGPGWSRRGRLTLLGVWVALTAVGWCLSVIGGA